MQLAYTMASLCSFISPWFKNNGQGSRNGHVSSEKFKIKNSLWTTWIIIYFWLVIAPKTIRFARPLLTHSDARMLLTPTLKWIFETSSVFSHFPLDVTTARRPHRFLLVVQLALDSCRWKVTRIRDPKWDKQKILNAAYVFTKLFYRDKGAECDMEGSVWAVAIDTATGFCCLCPIMG